MWEFIGGILVGGVAVGAYAWCKVRELKGYLNYYKRENEAAGKKVNELEKAAGKRRAA